MVPDSPPDPLDPDAPPPTTAEHPVMEQLQRARRGARWHMSRHTLELAIGALEIGDDAPAPRPSGPGKRRRRKRHKRLL